MKKRIFTIILMLFLNTNSFSVEITFKGDNESMPSEANKNGCSNELNAATRSDLIVNPVVNPLFNSIFGNINRRGTAESAFNEMLTKPYLKFRAARTRKDLESAINFFDKVLMQSQQTGGSAEELRAARQWRDFENLATQFHKCMITAWFPNFAATEEPKSLPKLSRPLTLPGANVFFCNDRPRGMPKSEVESNFTIAFNPDYTASQYFRGRDDGAAEIRWESLRFVTIPGVPPNEKQYWVFNLKSAFIDREGERSGVRDLRQGGGREVGTDDTEVARANGLQWYFTPALRSNEYEVSATRFIEQPPGTFISRDKRGIGKNYLCVKRY